MVLLFILGVGSFKGEFRSFWTDCRIELEPLVAGMGMENVLIFFWLMKIVSHHPCAPGECQ